MADKVWLSRKEAADYLTSIGCRMSARTLEQMASNNNARGGPPFNRSGWKLVSYNRDELTQWAARRIKRVE